MNQMTMVSTSSSELRFEKNIKYRAFNLICSIGLSALFLSLPLLRGFSRNQFIYCAPLEIYPKLLEFSYIILCGQAFAAVLLYESGPSIIIFDKITLCYRFRRSFPFFAKWNEGSYADIDGLYLNKSRNRNNKTEYNVMLAWNGFECDRSLRTGHGSLNRRKDLLLFNSKSNDEARNRLEAIAADLNILSYPLDSDKFNYLSSRNRMRKLTPLLFGFLIFWLLIIMHFGTMVLIQNQLDAEGKKVVGMVVEPQEDEKYAVKYEYKINGANYYSRDRVIKREHPNLKSGSRILITYLPKYPATTRTEYSDARRFGSAMFKIYAVLVTAKIILFIYYMRKRLKKI